MKNNMIKKNSKSFEKYRVQIFSNAKSFILVLTNNDKPTNEKKIKLK